MHAIYCVVVVTFLFLVYFGSGYFKTRICELFVMKEVVCVWDGTRFIMRMVISLTDSSEPKLGWPLSERAGSESVPVRGGLGCEERTSCVQSGQGLLGWAGGTTHRSEEASPDIAPHQLKWSIKTDGKTQLTLTLQLSRAGWVDEVLWGWSNG